MRNDFYWGRRAAGVLLVTDDGYFLAVMRSLLVDQPRQWGVPGGAADPGEDYFSMAIRESSEELGSLPAFELAGHVRYEDPNSDFTYITYILKVRQWDAKNWNVELDWENDAAAWFAIDHPPAPIHFGLRYVLKNGNEIIRSCVSKPVRRRNPEPPGHRFSSPVYAFWGRDPEDRVIVQVLGPTWAGDLRFWDVLDPEIGEFTASAAELFTASGMAWRLID